MGGYLCVCVGGRVEGGGGEGGSVILECVMGTYIYCIP